MRKRTRKIACLSALLLLAALLLSCAGSRDSTPQIAVIVKATDSDFWHAVRTGVESAAIEYNVSVTFEGPESEEDCATQNRMSADVVARGADVIELSAIDYDQTADAENTDEQSDNTESTDSQSADTASDAEVLGEGETVFTFIVTDADGNDTQFEIHTDKKTVGEALLDVGLIAGEDSEYGLYVKTVNGVTADYDTDQTYWAFYVDGEYAQSGVDSTDITVGSTYSFKIEK